MVRIGTPAAAHHPVARNHDFRVPAAGWRETAAQADTRGAGREQTLIHVDRSDGRRLRVQDDHARDEDGEGSRNDSRIR
jgi:hypothetical protein